MCPRRKVLCLLIATVLQYGKKKKEEEEEEEEEFKSSESVQGKEYKHLVLSL